MSDEKYRRFWEYARRYCAERGFPRQAEDFAQEASLKQWQAGRNLNMHWFFVDWMRKQYGDTRRAKSRVDFEDVYPYQLFESRRSDLSFKAKWQDYIDTSTLTEDQKILAELMWDQEFLAVEIAKMWGCDESLISWKMRPLKAEIKKVFNLKFRPRRVKRRDYRVSKTLLEETYF